MIKRKLGSAQSGTSILGRIIENGRRGMTPAVARQILKFGFSHADQDRMADLAERNQLGKLSAAEKAKLMEYVDAGHIVATLHSLARQTLKRSRTAKA